MSEKIKVRLLKPLDGMPEGSPAEFDKNEIAALEAMNAVRVVRADPAKIVPSKAAK